MKLERTGLAIALSAGIVIGGPIASHALTMDFGATSGGSSSMFFDDVVFQATVVPEPSGILLFGAGLVAVLGSGRRRRETLG